ncbi:hypothetical protein os1_02680 [Comamonadaceae bacterium OS-1]|nr:hypothetical protein os1_02680 [Comamonadaceae bacterium OS-1]
MGEGHSAENQDLEAQKLRLEIANLQRSPWLQPGVAIPLAATLATLALSLYLGVFEVERKRIEVSNREAQLAKAELAKDIEGLSRGKAELEGEKLKLSEERKKLTTEIASLRTQADAAYLKLYGATIAELHSRLLSCASVGTKPEPKSDIIGYLQSDIASCMSAQLEGSSLSTLLRSEDVTRVKQGLSKVASRVLQKRTKIFTDAERELARLDDARSIGAIGGINSIWLQQDFEAKYRSQYRRLLEDEARPLLELKPA